MKKKDDQQGSRDVSTEIGASEGTDAIEDISLSNASTTQFQRAPEPFETEKGVSETSKLDEPNETHSTQTHNRHPSLSLQSQLRSSSFRRTSVSQAPTSPPPNVNTSPIIPLLSPEGDTVSEIYRKQTSRIDELERENRRLAKDASESETRWKKTEEELEELRESSGEVAELKLRAGGADAKSEEIEKLVCRISPESCYVSQSPNTAKEK